MNNELLNWLKKPHQLTEYRCDLQDIPNLHDYLKKDTKGCIFYVPFNKGNALFPLISIINTKARMHEIIGTHDQLHDPYETSLALINQITNGLLSVVIVYAKEKLAVDADQLLSDMETIEAFCQEFHVQIDEDKELHKQILDESTPLFKALSLSETQITSLLSIYNSIVNKYLKKTFDHLSIKEIIAGHAPLIPYYMEKNDLAARSKKIRLLINSTKEERKKILNAPEELVVGISNFIVKGEETMNQISLPTQSQMDDYQFLGEGVLYGYLNVAVYKNILEKQPAHETTSGVLRLLKQAKLSINLSSFYQEYYDCQIASARIAAEEDPKFVLKTLLEQEQDIANTVLFYEKDCLKHDDFKWIKEVLTESQFNELYNMASSFLSYMRNRMLEKGYVIKGEGKTSVAKKQKTPTKTGAIADANKSTTYITNINNFYNQSQYIDQSKNVNLTEK